MKYTIISVSNNRESFKVNIREAMSGHEEVTDIDFVGPDQDIQALVNESGIFRDTWNPTAGEAGIWLSQMNCWEWVVANDEPLIVFEDDALITSGFDAWYNLITSDTDRSPDAMALFVPENQYNGYTYQWLSPIHTQSYLQGAPIYNIGSEYLAKAYQGYSCVGMQYWPSGAKKLIDLANEFGMYTPVDCFIYEACCEQDRGFRVSGVEIWAPKPDYAGCIDVDWDTPSERIRASTAGIIVAK